MTVNDTALARLPKVLHLPAWFISVSIGAAFAVIAVALRAMMPFPPIVLTTGFVFPAMMLSAVLGGTLGGITTFLLGGLLSWYVIIEPRYTWASSGNITYNLIGFFIIGATVLAMAELYRRGERKLQQTKVAFAQREAQHQQLLSREMDHRVKNMLGLVQAVAYQTFNHLDGNAVHEFNGRLKAVADAQAIITRDNSHAADLLEIITTAIKPFQSGNITVVGDTSIVPDQQAVWLSLTIHELATNATKYGALSLPYGRVTIDTHVDDKGIRLVWQEHNGPKVVAPTETGFGTKLLSQAKAKVEYLPGGVRCEIRRNHAL